MHPAVYLCIVIMFRFSVVIPLAIPRFVARSIARSISTNTKFVQHRESFPSVTPDQWQLLSRLSDYLCDWNQKVNLVSRKDIDDLIPNHIIPSMAVSLSKKFATGEKVIDIGTGGGLPGLPLAILFSDVQFTLLDSNSKKMMVVKDIVQSLSLKNVEVVASRSEVFRGQFDVLLGRGVSALPTFLALSSHLLKTDAAEHNGLFYIKGGDFSNELKEAAITQHSKSPVKELVILSNGRKLHPEAVDECC